MTRNISSLITFLVAGVLLFGFQSVLRADSCAAKSFASNDGGATGLVFRTSVFTKRDTTPDTNSTIYMTAGTWNFSAFYTTFSTYQDDDGSLVAFGAGTGWLNGKTPVVASYTLRQTAKGTTISVLITDYRTHATIYSTKGAMPITSGSVTINL